MTCQGQLAPDQISMNSMIAACRTGVAVDNAKTVLFLAAVPFLLCSRQSSQLRDRRFTTHAANLPF